MPEMRPILEKHRLSTMPSTANYACSGIQPQYLVICRGTCTSVYYNVLTLLNTSLLHRAAAEGILGEGLEAGLQEEHPGQMSCPGRKISR
jgi:hypothetical protein